MIDDPLLDEHAALMIRAVAWTAAWKRRHEHGAAAMVTLMSAQHLGAPVSVQLEKRLLLAKAHIEVRLADLAGRLAGAIAALGGDADTSAVATVVREAVTRVGGADEDFGSKIAELGPLADGYRRLRTALG